jgi:hypothetical protein
MNLPLAIIRAYLLIPARVRWLWRLSGGVSTSHLALAAALSGESWSAFRYARLSLGPGLSAAWKLGEGGRGAP